MALENVVKAIAGLLVTVLHSPVGAGPAAPTDGKDVPKDKPSFRLGPFWLLAGMSLVAAGGLWFSQAVGTVKIGFDREKGFVLEITKLQRPIVEELEGMRYPDRLAAQVRQIRSNGRGPWDYPRLALAARTGKGIPRHEAAVCRDSELLGERVVLSNKANGPEGLLAVKVSASWIVIGCAAASSGDEIILLGAEDMKALAGTDGARQLEVFGSVLAKDLTSPLENSAIELAGSPDQPNPRRTTGDDT